MNQIEHIKLKQKYTFKIHDKKLVLKKNAYESRFHVLAKAFAYAAFYQYYPDMIVEPKRVGRYRPDIICVDSQNQPCFWAECGKIQTKKIKWITNHHRNLHFAIIKKDKEMLRFSSEIKKHIHDKFRGKLELIEFPSEILECYKNMIVMNPDDYSPRIMSIKN